MPRFSAHCFRLARLASLFGVLTLTRANPPSWAGGSGNASDNSKWSNLINGLLPSALDTVSISSGSITFAGNTTYGALLLSGGDLNGNATLTLGTAATSSWTGGSLSFSNGQGLAISKGATLSVNGNGSVHDFAGSSISNTGTFDWSAGQLRTGSAGSINNSGTFKDSASDSINNAFGGTTGSFNNSGAYNKNASGTTTIALVFANTGSVNINSGTLELTGGGSNGTGAKLNIGSGAALKFGGGNFAVNTASDITDSGGTLEFSGGAVTFGGGSISVGNVAVTGGTVNFSTAGGATSNALNISSGTLASGTYSTSGYNQTGGSVTGANVTLSGAGHAWSGGDMNGSGTLTLGTGSLLSISGSATHDFNQHAIANSGAINWTGGELRTGGNGGIDNAGTFNDAASTNISNAFGGAQGQFRNSGTYNKSESGTTTIGLTFANTGAVNVSAGTLQLAGGGSNSAGAGVTVTNGAELRFGGGTYTVDDAADISAGDGVVSIAAGDIAFSKGTLAAGNIAVTGGSLSFTHGGGSANTLTVSGGTLASGNFTTAAYSHTGGSITGANVEVTTGANTWSAGDMNGAGNLTIDGSATLAINGSSTHDFKQHGITNNGNVSWSTGQLRTGDNGSVTNNGTFDDTASSSITNAFGGTLGRFSNAGSYNKNGTGTTTIGLDFENTGTVNVGNGTLELNGGGANATGAKINIGAGNGLKFSGGTFTIASAADIVDGGGTYTFAGGTTTFTSGNTSLANVTVTGGTVGFTAGGVNSNALTVTGGMLASGNFTTGAYTHAGGSATGAAVRVTGGNASWSGGDMNGTGSLTLESAASLTIDTASTHDFSQHTINNNGNVTWSSGQLRTGSNGAITNNGTFTDNASDAISNAFGGDQSTFTNAGTYHKAAAGNTTISLAFANHGAVSVDAGALKLTGGGSSDGAFSTAANATTEFGADYALTTGAALQGSGKYAHTAGTLNVGTNVSVENLSQSGGTLTPTGTLTVANLILTGGTLGGVSGSDVQVTGNITWTNGDMNGNGKTTLGSGVALTIDDTVTNARNFSGHEIVNHGTVNWKSGYLQSGHGGSFTNEVGATFNDTNSAGYSINAAYGDGATFTNNGTYDRNATGTTYFDTTFNNNGALKLQKGDIQVRQGGTMGASSVASVSSGAHLYIANNYTVSDGAQFRGSGLVAQIGGTLTLDGRLLADSFDWTGGNWNASSGSPTTTIDSTTTLNLSDTTDNARDFNGRHVVNRGTVNWNSGYLRSGNSGDFTNDAGGVFNDLNASNYSFYNPFGGTYAFINNGTYIRNTTGTTYFDTTFNNNGTVTLRQGDIQIRQGGAMGSGSVVNASSGTHLYFTNNYTIGDGAQFRGAGVFDQTAGTLTINGALAADAFLWSGGNWNAATGSNAASSVAAGTVLNLADTHDNTRDFNARTITNHGVVNWNSGYLRSGNSGAFVNASDGTFNDVNTSSYSLYNPFGGAFTFTNNGAYVRNTTGTTYFDTTFENNGTVNLQQGDILVRQGGTMGANSVVNVSSGAHFYFTNNYTLADGAQFRGAGLVAQTGGTLTANGHLAAASFEWSGGNWNAVAGSNLTTTIASGTVLNLTDAHDNTRDFDGRNIVNEGVVNWYSGYLRSGNGGSFTNASGGVFNDRNASGYTVNNPFGGTFAFTNNGTYNKTTGGTTTVYIPFTNAGTLNLTSGRMVFNGTFTNNGSLVLSNGAAAQFAAPVAFTSTFLGGTGTLSAPSVTAGGTVSPGNSPGTLAVTGDFTLLNTSLLLIELGGTTQGTQYDYLNVGGNVTLGGSLNLKFVNGFGSSVLGTDQFTILSAGGAAGLTGAFANVASGGRLSTLDGIGSFQVNYDGVNAVTLTNFQPVPEPSTYVLLSGGLLAVYAGLRRRRRG